MIPMCSDAVKSRLVRVLEKYSLPTDINVDENTLISYIYHDKKSSGTKITAIFVNDIGFFEMKQMEIDELRKYINGGVLH